MTSEQLAEEFEVRDLVRWDDPILLQPAEKYDHSVELAAILEDQLITAMKKHGGLGISACQIGIPARAFALNVNPAQAIFNPRVVDATSEGQWQDEACLSFPGLVAPVWRPNIIKLRFTTSDGQVHNEKYQGLTARTVLHELDHLNGRLFFDRLGPVKLGLVVKAAKKLGFNYPLGKIKQIAQQSINNTGADI